MNRPALLVMAGLVVPALIHAGDNGASESPVVPIPKVETHNLVESIE